MPRDVISSSHKKGGIIIEPTNPLVAVCTQQPAHFTRRVAVIDGKALCSAAHNMSFRALAYRTDVVLGLKHGVVHFFRELIVFEGAFQPCDSHANFTFFRIAVMIRRCLGAALARGLEAVCALAAVFMEVMDRFYQTTFAARFGETVANGPFVFGVMRVVRHRFPLYPPTFRTCFGGYGGYFTASAVAQMKFAHGESYYQGEM